MHAQAFTEPRQLWSGLLLGCLLVAPGLTAAVNCEAHRPDLPPSVLGRVFGAYALSANGDRLAVTVEDGGWSDVFVYAVPGGKLLWRRDLPTPASALALSPNGSRLAIAFATRPRGCPHVELLNASSGQRAAELEDRGELSSVLGDSAHAVAFSRDSTLLAGALDNAVRIWNTGSGRNARSIQPPGFDTRRGVEPMEDIAFTPDGKRIAAASARSPVVRVWETATGTLAATLRAERPEGSLSSIVFDSRGSLLAAGSTGPILIWNSETGRLTTTIPKFGEGPIWPVTFLNGARLVIGVSEGLQLWNVAKQAVRDPEWQAESARVDTAFLLSGGALWGVASGTEWKDNARTVGHLRLLDVRTGRLIAAIEVAGRSRE